jgi:ABC-type multidrug transport system fused ATPase/permease subunit
MQVYGMQRAFEATGKAQAQAVPEWRVDLLATPARGRRERVNGAPPGLPRLFRLEEEFRGAMLEAEISWLRGLIDYLREGPGDVEPPVAARGRRGVHRPECRGGAHPTVRTRTPEGQVDGTDDRGRRLRKRFGKTKALDGLDLVAERGQVVAVLRPNGAGKTTFVRVVATLLPPDEGTLRVAGHDVVEEPGTNSLAGVRPSAMVPGHRDRLAGKIVIIDHGACHG